MCIPHDKAMAIQRVLDGQDEGTPAQQEFALTVERIYFSRKADWKQPVGPTEQPDIPFNERGEHDL